MRGATYPNIDSAFLDFRKALDTINRSLLWKNLWKIGCPKKFVNLIACLHNNMKAQVRFKGDPFESFRNTNGCISPNSILDNHVSIASPRLLQLKPVGIDQKMAVCG